MMYDGGMMSGMGAMMWGMGFVSLLVIAVLILGAMALAKYVFFSHSHRR